MLASLATYGNDEFGDETVGREIEAELTEWSLPIGSSDKETLRRIWKMKFNYRRSATLRIGSAMVLLSGFATLRADSIVMPNLAGFTFNNSDPSCLVPAAGCSSIIVNSPVSFTFTGDNTGSGLGATSTFTSTATSAGEVVFQWSYSSLDVPGFDNVGYIAGGNIVQLADTDGESGTSEFNITPGELYGWFADTQDNLGEPGILNVSLLDSTQGGQTQAPEPRFTVVIVLLLGGLGAIASRKRIRAAAPLVLFAAVSLHAQTESHFAGAVITGQIQLTNVVNPSQISASQAGAARLEQSPGWRSAQAVRFSSRIQSGRELPSPRFMAGRALGFSRTVSSGGALAFRSLSVADTNASTPSLTGFNALSHYDQRNADSGNQLSWEPPSPSVAIANGFVLEGVNNAVTVFDKSGTALVPALSSNQWFGLASEYDRNTGISGPTPTDMRVYYDADISRWFVLQRAQDNDFYGDPLNSSHIYMAVSATSDPTGKWNVYTFNSTDTNNPGCPCFPDYLQVGSDQYGFYITADEYDTATGTQPVDSIVIAISKAALGTGAAQPATVLFQIPFVTGYEFAIHPATTPPGSSKFLANGGVEFFVSSQAFFSENSRIGLWSMSNTASLGSQSPSPLITETSVQTEWYFFPGVANQKPGPIPYGQSLFPPGQLEYLDGNSDSRVQSVSYAGGRLFVTLPTQVTDSAGDSVVGGAYMILSPTFRSSTLSATVLEQGYLSVVNNHILRPAIAVNSQGAGAITFTLVGPDYFPSAAYVTFDLLNTPSSVQVAAPGVAPEDGFSGYPPYLTAPIARWGDYSTAAADADGSIWMATEYIPNGPRTLAANWGTYISKYVP